MTHVYNICYNRKINIEPPDRAPERPASPDDRSKIYGTAWSLLLSDRATSEQTTETWFDDDGKPIIERRLSLTAADEDVAIQEALQALGLEQVGINYTPAFIDITTGDRQSGCIWMLLDSSHELAQGDRGSAGAYYMAYSEDEGKAEVIIETEGDNYLNIMFDSTTYDPVHDLTDYDENTIDTPMPEDRPITQREADGLQRILEAVKGAVDS